MTRCLCIAFFLCLACARMPRAEGGLLPDGHLDTAAVRDGYLRADMPFVRSALEGFIKNHPHQVGAQEKVFTHLYLGAIYAGEKDGRAKAEAHFRAALKADPYSDPADLYLPPATKTWFERLRADVLRSQAQQDPSPTPGTLPATPAPTAPPVPDKALRQAPPALPKEAVPDTPMIVRPPDPDRSRGSDSGPSPQDASLAASPSRGWLWWTLGAAAAGAGALTWVELDAKPKPRHVQVDATLK
ncbi:MAG: hypothetical protein JF616_03270 [Fibrobacteres bacterium]|nr:hypothetical protein [Fibrobacterota bacterium]